MKNSDRNLARYILDSLNNNKDEVFIIDEEKEYTHHDFLALVNRIYSHIPKGKILVNLKSKLFIAATFTACLFKKALPFIRNINQESSPLDEYSYDLVVDDSRIKEMIEDENYQEYVYDGNVEPNQPALGLLSSGTSAKNKVIILSQSGILEDILSVFEIHEIEKGWRFVNITPFDHAMGIVGDYLMVLLSGSSVVYSYSVIEYFYNVEKYKPHCLHITSNLCDTLYDLIKEKGKGKFDDRLTQIVVGGSKCRNDIISDFAKYQVTVCSCYGLTECSPVVSLSSSKYYKEGSDGKILSCNKIRIADDGEIVISGKAIMLNYLEEYEKGEIVKEIKTKDIGYIEDGYIYVVGRKDNLIVLPNGEKIQPEVFENRLLENPHVKEAILYFKNQALYLDVVLNDKYDLYKDMNGLDVTINYVDSLIKNQLGKVDRKAYR